MAHSPLRVFFSNWIDADNYNAQSLNVRELALRLDPTRFRPTLFFEHTPDARFLNDSRFRLLRIPPRLGTATMLREIYRGYDILFRANALLFTKLFLYLPRVLQRGCKVVHWMEEPTKPYLQFENPRRERAYIFIQARVLHRYAVTEFVARSNFAAYDLSCEGVIPVGVDTKKFRFVSRPAGRAPTVLFIGHLIERKKPDLVLDAARCFPHIQFILVGGKRGDFYKKLFRIVQDWKLTNVTFREPMPQTELHALMQTCDILLHPSQVEGLPKAVIEAAATGLPAIIFDHYQAPAVMDGVTGFQVHTRQEMLERLARLLEDAPLRAQMGVAAAEHVKQFDWDIVARRWENVFLELAERRE